ncbi:MAG: hypothetical protein ACR2MX_19885 [Cyclobacteriaceae bacterium]
MQDRENYKVHLLFIGLILMVDVLIYLLLELLLDGYSTYYGQGSGSYPNINTAFKERLVFSALYIWDAINLLCTSILVYRIFTERRKRPIKLKKHSI